MLRTFSSTQHHHARGAAAVATLWNGPLFTQSSCCARRLHQQQQQGSHFQINRILPQRRHYQKPASLVEWEAKASQELERNRKTQKGWTTIDQLRTERVTPEGIAVQPVYYDLDNNNNNPALPGVFPYTRGPYATMYTAGAPWTVRQYAGFSTAHESNAFYRRNLAAGQQGLSVAFDLPTHRGYDSDHARCTGDVGMAGVPIDCVEDMHILFRDIDLTQVSVSMTMNGAVLPVLAFYIQTALEQQQQQLPGGGAAATNEPVLKKLRGTIQNDILKGAYVTDWFGLLVRHDSSPSNLPMIFLFCVCSRIHGP